MGALYDIKMKIEKAIEERNLDGATIRGTISLKSGFFLAMLKPDTPDDPAKLDKLRKAAEAVLHLKL